MRRRTEASEPHGSDGMSVCTEDQLPPDKMDHDSVDPPRGVLSEQQRGVEMAIELEQEEALPEQPVTDLRLCETMLHDDA